MRYIKTCVSPEGNQFEIALDLSSRNERLLRALGFVSEIDLLREEQEARKKEKQKARIAAMMAAGCTACGKSKRRCTCVEEEAS